MPHINVTSSSPFLTLKHVTLSHTHTLSLSHTHTHTHALSLSLTHTRALSLSHTHTRSLSLSHTHTHTHTRSLSLSFTHTHTLPSVSHAALLSGSCCDPELRSPAPADVCSYRRSLLTLSSNQNSHITSSLIS